MPKIPVYTNQATLDASPLVYAARGAEMAGRRIAAATETAFGVASDIAKRIDQHEADAEISKTANDLSDFELQKSKEYAQAKLNADPNDQNFASNFIDQNLMPDLDKMGENLTTAQGQKYFQEARIKMREGFAKRAIADQSNMEADARVANADQSENKLMTAAGLDPSLTGHYMDMADTVIGPTLPAEHRSTVIAKMKESIANSGAEAFVSRVENNPNASIQDAENAIAVLNDSSQPFVGNMSAEKHQALIDRLSKVKDTQLNIQSALAKDSLPSLIDQIKLGGAPDKVVAQAQNIAATYVGRTPQETAVERQRMAREVTAATQQGRTVSAIREMPDDKINDERQKTLAAYTASTDPAERAALKGQLDGIDAGQKARDAEFLKDPSTYAINHNQTVTARAMAFDKNPTPQTWAEYTAASEAYQRQLFPGRVPQFATPQMKQQIAAALQGVTTDKNGVAKAGQVLSQWSGMTGGKWVQVAHELHNDKILNDEQFVAGMLYANPAARGIADNILEAGSMTGEQRYAMHKVPSVAATGAAIDQFQDLAKSLGNAPNGAALVTAHVKALSAYLQVHGTPDDLDGPAADIAKKMVNDEYTFHDTLRIPNAPGIDSGKIVKGTEAVLDDIGNHPLVIPASNSGLGPMDQKTQYIDRLKSGARWYTNEDGSGAILYDMEGGRAVMETIKGKPRPVELKWKDLDKSGEGALNILDRAGRLLTGAPQ